MDRLVDLFCEVDDFSQEFKPVFEKHLRAKGKAFDSSRKNLLPHKQTRLF